MQHILLEACATGDTFTFSNLHEEDRSVLDQRNGSQDTPLHLASRFNHKELASMIINLQPDMVVTRNDEEETPLHEACRAGGFDIIELLLNQRPSLAYCRNRAKESALLIACSRGHSQVAFKLANTLPSLAWDQSGSLACLLMAASEGDTDIVKKILRESPSLASKKDENGFSALHLASRNGKLEIIREFLGEDPYLILKRENEGRTPLHWAVMSGQLPVVEEFLLERDRPASFNSVLSTDLINSADNNGDTVLHLAAKMKSTEIFDFLVRKPGMKVHAPNKEGMTAIDISNQNSISLRGKHTAAQVDADVPVDLKCRMLFLLLTHILAVSIGVNPDLWNQKNDIPGMETTPWWFSTALMLFLIATMIVLFHYTFPQMIRRPWDFVEEVAVCSIDLAIVRFLLKIADGDPLFELILTLVSLVPLMGFCWIWHKLERLRQCWFDATGPKSD
ncbi:hypothetical protein AAC387_Pa03g3816 [Persea americana]